MEDLDILAQREFMHTVLKELDKLKLEVISRSGLVPRSSHVRESSTFDIIWEITCYELRYKLKSICIKQDTAALEDYKEDFVNKFMNLLHRHVVAPTKFNWNWDQTFSLKDIKSQDTLGRLISQ